MESYSVIHSYGMYNRYTVVLGRDSLWRHGLGGLHCCQKEPEAQCRGYILGKQKL